MRVGGDRPLVPNFREASEALPERALNVLTVVIEFASPLRRPSDPMHPLVVKTLLLLTLGLAACGGSKAPATASNTTPTEGSTATPAEPATPPAPTGTCESQGGTCTSKMAAIACASWPEATDCGTNEGCCVMAAAPKP